MRRVVAVGFGVLALLIPVAAASASPTIGNCDAPAEKIVFEVHNEDGPAGDWHVCLAKP